MAFKFYSDHDHWQSLPSLTATSRRSHTSDSRYCGHSDVGDRAGHCQESHTAPAAAALAVAGQQPAKDAHPSQAGRREQQGLSLHQSWAQG